MPKTSHNNTFSIREVESNGKVRYTIMLYYWDKAGKRHMKRGGSAPTRTRAEIEAKRQLKAIESDIKIVKYDDSINGLLKKYREYMESVKINERGYRGATKRSYIYNIDALLKHTSTDVLTKTWKSVDKTLIRKWCRDLLNAKKDNGEILSPNRVDKLLDVITNNKRGFFAWLETNGYFDGIREDDYFIFHRTIKNMRPELVKGTRVDRFLTYEEFKVFIDQKNWKDNQKDRMYRLAFNMLFFTGMRLSELRPLTWNDLDFDEDLIRVNKSITLRVLKEDRETYLKSKDLHKPKTSEGQRFIPILPELKKELLKPYTMTKNKKALIFHNEENMLLSDNAFVGRFKTQLKRAKIDKQLSPHDLRRSFAQHICHDLKISLGHAKDMMGHTDTRLLEEVYAKMKSYKKGRALVEVVDKAYKEKELKDRKYKESLRRGVIDEEDFHELPEKWKE